MKTLKCHYYKTKECDFIAKGKDRDDTIRAIMDHTAKKHPELMDDMTPDIQKMV